MCGRFGRRLSAVVVADLMLQLAEVLRTSAACLGIVRAVMASGSAEWPMSQRSIMRRARLRLAVLLLECFSTLTHDAIRPLRLALAAWLTSGHEG